MATYYPYDEDFNVKEIQLTQEKYDKAADDM